jgi:hypothetical protein
VGTGLTDVPAVSAGVPPWTWAIPLIVGVIALAGVAATAFILTPKYGQTDQICPRAKDSRNAAGVDK